ncbi:MAG: hypothetical protein IIU83_00270 [Fibrobacteraceae bacterium]|nr:hypothetical protein [Fibrobacteraceae bacterium]
MEQKSNVQYRAEKEYKNSREKFSLLLREIISNSIHAVLIRQSKETDFSPKVTLNIHFDDDSKTCQIVLTDNGEGFTEKNSRYFEELDRKNAEKERFNFHPLGQGRLAIVFFSDSSVYETVYRDKNNSLRKRQISYPDINDSLFSCDLFSEEEPIENDSFTKLTILINKNNSFGRAKTFFAKHSDAGEFKQWFVETFFPFIVNNEKLVVSISFNENEVSVQKDDVEKNTVVLPFTLPLEKDDENDDGREIPFKLWLIRKNEKNIGDNPVACFARNLKAVLSNGKLSYAIDNDEGYLFYLTSDYFDTHVDSKGEKIEISNENVERINQKINDVLDARFKNVIEKNKETTKQNLKRFKVSFPSLESFVDDVAVLSGRNIVKEVDIVKTAIEEKSRIEKKFWTKDSCDNEDNSQKENFENSVECQKLLNSSLHIYVKHRERVLKRLHNLIQKFDKDGNDKPELESTVHELFLKRGVTLEDSSNINHLHNLWILDDKFTIFSNDFKAQSTRQGQSLSDIYIWADDPEKTKQVLIFELKSTTNAHNAGDKYEGMIAQVKRYAKDFYQDPKKILNWDVDTNAIQYIGVILARKSDINKELSSNNVSGDFEKIPFLSSSYYKEERFSTNPSDPSMRKPIRIELYSFEDIYELAYSRNQVFFKLLKNEFSTDKT